LAAIVSLAAVYYNVQITSCIVRLLAEREREREGERGEYSLQHSCLMTEKRKRRVAAENRLTIKDEECVSGAK
jgi:hypothetical protein